MKQHNIIIRQETPADYAAVEHLTREAFWNVYRPGCLEHYVVHVLRNDSAFVPELDLVMEQDGALIGHVLYMRAIIKADDGREIPMMTFGPISIRPDLQRRGLGKYLLDYSMEKPRNWRRCSVHRGKPGFLWQIRLCFGRDPGNPLPRGTGAGTGSIFSAERAPSGLSGRRDRRLSYAPRLLCG